MPSKKERLQLLTQEHRAENQQGYYGQPSLGLGKVETAVPKATRADSGYLPPTSVVWTPVLVIQESGRYYVFGGKVLAVCPSFSALMVKCTQEHWIIESYKQEPPLADKYWWG